MARAASARRVVYTNTGAKVPMNTNEAMYNPECVARLFLPRWRGRGCSACNG